MADTQPNNTPSQPVVAPAGRPNEHGTIAVQGFFRITDPATQRIIVEGRA